MKRKHFTLTENLAETVEKRSKETGLSESEICRNAIRNHTEA